MAKRLHAYMECDGGGSPSPVVHRSEAVRGEVVRGECHEDFLKELSYPGQYFPVLLSRDSTQKVGWELLKRCGHLEVSDVHAEGVLASWNKENPAMQVKKHDRIVEVNGIQGNGAMMMDALRESLNSNLRVFRAAAIDLKSSARRKVEKDVKKVLKEPAPAGLGQGIPEVPGSKVAVLHANNFDKFVRLQPMALVMFYASWCGHCKELAPEYSKAAQLVSEMNLAESVRFAKFDDGDQVNRAFGAAAPEKYNITSYPALFFFKRGVHKPFYGDRGAHEIAAHVKALVKGLDPEEEIKKSLLHTRPMMYRQDTPAEKVLDLEPETFDPSVLQESAENNVVWIIEYYSDKCPFCKSLKPEYIKASEAVSQLGWGSRVRFAAVNSRAFHDLAERFGVTSYPWVISVYAGKKVEDMAGLGGADSVIKWAERMYNKVWTSEPVWNTGPVMDAKATAGASSLAESATFNNTGSWRELLGRRTWFFLHSLAAKYPEEPTEEDEAAMRGIVAGLGQLYACPICRQHLQAKLQDPRLGPVKTGSRTALSLWFCELHNIVNKDLGKPEQPCTAFKLDLQYLKSCGECSASPASEEQSDPAEQVRWSYYEYLQSDMHRDEL